LETTDEVELCFLYQGPIYTEEEIGCRIVNINELQAAEVKTFSTTIQTMIQDA